MKTSTKNRKQSAKQFQQLFGADEFNLKIAETINWGKQSIDLINKQVGKMMRNFGKLWTADKRNIAA